LLMSNHLYSLTGKMSNAPAHRERPRRKLSASFQTATRRRCGGALG
jgi:hypothetical protein